MKHSYGFTFIELSVVLAILGILGLIAIPQYSTYRERMYSNAAISDLKNVAAAQEAYFVDNQSYKTITECGQVNSSAKCPVAGLPGVNNLSKGIALSVTTSPSGFIATARHYRASKTCTWDSTKGGLVGCS
jgi:prepilin-type N-terminal cleavage/methylation domain-containing protein